MKAFEDIALDKENFESWVDETLSVRLTDAQWQKVCEDLDDRLMEFVDEMVYSVVVDFRNGLYDPKEG